MKPFKIAATKSTPYILIDPAGQAIEIRGESYPENVAEFYNPVFQQITDFLDAVPPDGMLTVNIEMVYFNSSSSKVLMNLFDMFDEKAGAGLEIVINWMYDQENDIALEYGEEFLEDLEDVTFNLVEIHSEEDDRKSL